MKKIVAFLFCLILVAALSVSVFAAQQLQFTIVPSKTTAAPGEEISFSVKVTGSECVSLGYIPEYDKNILEMVSGRCTAQGTSLASFSNGQGGVLLFEKVTAPDGEVFRFTMRVRDDAPAGEVTVSGEVAARNGGAVVPAKLIGAQLTVSTDSVGSDTPTEEKQPPQQTEGTVAPEETGSGDVPAQPEGTAAAPEEMESENAPAQNEGTAPAESTGQDSVENQPADPVPKTTLWWIPMVVVLVAAVAVVTVILMIKKKKV